MNKNSYKKKIKERKKKEEVGKEKKVGKKRKRKGGWGTACFIVQLSQKRMPHASCFSDLSPRNHLCYGLASTVETKKPNFSILLLGTATWQRHASFWAQAVLSVLGVMPLPALSERRFNSYFIHVKCKISHKPLQAEIRTWSDNQQGVTPEIFCRLT